MIATWNELIVKNYNNGSAKVLQNAAVTALMEAAEKPREHIFHEKWLDIEDVFRASGWSVKYDKPAYNESYEPSFLFKPKG